ncbi:hypothetical protein KVT40_004059 [Elsinoe batatas]|uniref:ASST-domain-containing protein n=1 Tax=Elsinoe batatas TaxID=2601811 RepID=A0A8K0PFS8_9PEZI|nr:hypothetical protein KVT40_004059 [Elsinoe batatas]
MFLTTLFFAVLFIQGGLCDIPPFNNSSDYLNGKFGNYTRQRFLSDEGVIAPVANVLVPAGEGVSPSRHTLWVPTGPRVGVTHPILLDTKTLSVVWHSSMNAKLGAAKGRCNGTDYMYHWSQTGTQFHDGRFFFHNSKYELVYNVTTVGKFPSADAHDLYLTPNCTVVFPVVKEHPFNLTAYNITNGILKDAYFQEVDLATNQLLFEWRASKFIDPFTTYWDPETRKEGVPRDAPFDWFHINSVQKDDRGNYLVSSRHTHAIYYVSGLTGNVIWTVGGKQNNFRDMSSGKATDFAWQHHARWVDTEMTKIQLFDNRNTPWHSAERPYSRGIVLRLDTVRKEVWLEHEYLSQPLKAVREGSMQVLSDSPKGHTALVGYGQQPAITEFSEDGAVIWDVAFGPMHLDRESADNYRSLKFNWTGTPTWMPKIAPGPQPKYTFKSENSTFHIALRDDSGNSIPNNTAYFSWNGATEIKKWIVLASNHTSDLNMDHLWAEITKLGFETSSFVGESTRFVQALAIDDKDQILGQTDVLSMGSSDGLRGFSLSNSTAELHDLTAAWHAYLNEKANQPFWYQWHTKWEEKTGKAGTGSVVGVLVVITLFSVLILAARRYWRRSRGEGVHKGRTPGSFADADVDAEATLLAPYSDADSSHKEGSAWRQS